MHRTTGDCLLNETARFAGGLPAPQSMTAETDAAFTRFSGKDMFALYPGLKEEHEGGQWLRDLRL